MVYLQGGKIEWYERACTSVKNVVFLCARVNVTWILVHSRKTKWFCHFITSNVIKFTHLRHSFGVVCNRFEMIPCPFTCLRSLPYHSILFHYFSARLLLFNEFFLNSFFCYHFLSLHSYVSLYRLRSLVTFVCFGCVCVCVRTHFDSHPHRLCIYGTLNKCAFTYTKFNY